MEKQKIANRSEFAKKWKINELKGALKWAIGSIGLIVGALSISLVGYADANDNHEHIRVRAILDRDYVTIDPELSKDETMLVTVPDNPEMKGWSVRLAEGELEPPYMETVGVPVSDWKNLAYLLTITGQEIEELNCVVDPGTLKFEGGIGSYELECVDN